MSSSPSGSTGTNVDVPVYYVVVPAVLLGILVIYLIYAGATRKPPFARGQTGKNVLFGLLILYLIVIFSILIYDYFQLKKGKAPIMPLTKFILWSVLIFLVLYLIFAGIERVPPFEGKGPDGRSHTTGNVFLGLLLIVSIGAVIYLLYAYDTKNPPFKASNSACGINGRQDAEDANTLFTYWGLTAQGQNVPPEVPANGWKIDPSIKPPATSVWVQTLQNSITQWQTSKPNASQAIAPYAAYTPCKNEIIQNYANILQHSGNSS